MEFLVRIEIALPGELTPEERARLEADERRAGAELRATGTIVRIWRVPGRRANVGVWRAASPTELHRHLTALPMWPWMDVEVTALARHPLEEDA